MVDNALRHGGGAVRVGCTRANGSVELHVTDEGAGFAPELLAHAFERFSRDDRGRDRAGAGLGLAIVEAIARAHGGEARAANRSGGGADVWLVLPTDGTEQGDEPPFIVRSSTRPIIAGNRVKGD
jgi:two-component system OmpR family sensor kinase